MAELLAHNLSRTDNWGALWRETAWWPLPGSGSPLALIQSRRVGSQRSSPPELVSV